ncbi:hypothetical protein IX55_16045, partial [Paracoccus sanguinis]
MTLRAPGFWDRPPGVLARLLAPLGALYAAGTARRLARGTAARGGRARVGAPALPSARDPSPARPGVVPPPRSRSAASIRGRG